MRSFGIVLTLWALVTACSTNSTSRQPEQAARELAPTVTPPPLSFNSDLLPAADVYIGLLGKYPVVLGLKCTMTGFWGKYYYLHQADTYAQLLLSARQQADSLVVTEFDDQRRPTHVFRGVVSPDGHWQGRWKPRGKGPVLTFSLRLQQGADHEQYRNQWQQALTGAIAHDGWRLDTVSLHMQDDTTGVDPDRSGYLTDPLCYYRAQLSYARLHGGPAPLRSRLNALLATEARSHFEEAGRPQRIRPMTTRDTGQYCQYDHTMVQYLDQNMISYDALRTDETPHGDEDHYWCHRTLRLPELRPFQLTELLRGDFRALFRRYAQQEATSHAGLDRAASKDPDYHCTTHDLLQHLLMRIDTLRTTASVLVRPEGLQVLTYDPRAVGCPGVVRGPYPLLIPYTALRPYLNPVGPLAPVAAAQARRLQQVEAPFWTAGR